MGSGTEIVAGSRPRSRGGRSVVTAPSTVTRWTPGSVVGVPATQTTASGPSVRTERIVVNPVSSGVRVPSTSRTTSASNPSDERANTTRESSSTA